MKVLFWSVLACVVSIIGCLTLIGEKYVWHLTSGQTFPLPWIQTNLKCHYFLQPKQYTTYTVLLPDPMTASIMPALIRKNKANSEASTWKLVVKWIYVDSFKFISLRKICMPLVFVYSSSRGKKSCNTKYVLLFAESNLNIITLQRETIRSDIRVFHFATFYKTWH